MDSRQIEHFNPIVSSKRIVDSYKRYIHSIFRTDDSEYNKLLDVQLDKNELGKGPLLEITTQYETSNSVQQLVDEGILSKEFRRVINDNLKEFHLYRHQEDSIRKLSIPDLKGDYHSAIVTTGTGSGKTESFLFPIINYLLKEKEAGHLEDSVYALLLYPMNALANDQVDRIRDYLKDVPEIRFGCFTGDTKDGMIEALKDYNENHYDLNDGIKEPKNPPINELISREEMIETPPHILITNYAMLERLLILPKNERLFGTPDHNCWKFIVIDEAHTYSGAKGSEFAMLMRRIQARVNNHSLQYILTSATMGKEGDEQKIVDFAEKLCSVPFHIDDIIKSVPLKVEQVQKTDLGPQFYEEVALCIVETDDDLHTSDDNYMETIMGTSLLGILQKYGAYDEDPRDKLYDLISHDKLYIEIRKKLDHCPLTVDDLAELLDIDSDNINSFIIASSFASIKQGNRRIKLFDAKYHMFIRGFSGVYVTLKPNKSLFFAPANERVVNNEKMHVFKISTCYNCGALHILGDIVDSGLFVQPCACGGDDDDDVVNSYPYLLLSEDEISSIDDCNTRGIYAVCSKCGAACAYHHGVKPCMCGERFINIVRKSADDDKNCKCFRCNQVNNSRGVLRSLYLGQRAVSSTLMTSLYNELGSNPNTDRRILAFSDSRRAAGEFPPLVEESHHNLLMHRMIFEVLIDEHRNNPKKLEEGRTFDYIRNRLKEMIMDKLGYDDEKSESESWKYLMREFSCNNSNKSLSFNNMVRFELSADVKFEKLQSLSVEDTRELYNVLVKWIADKGAVVCRTIMGYAGIEHRKNIASESKGNNTEKFPTKAVEGYLKSFLSDEDLMRVKKTILSNGGILKNDGTGKCISVDDIVITLPRGHFYCTKCKKNYPFGIKNMCIRCNDKSLIWIDQEVFNEDGSLALECNDHYVNLYATMPMNDLRIEEHSGQIRRGDGYTIQKQFRDKEIDAISCSTTFEMGVDIGSLNTVFMRNMPPSPANYIQRAGRVGRSINSFAYILTYCKSQAHDSYYFDYPEMMINGEVPVPTIENNNPRIIQRHINSVAISNYWSRYGVTDRVEDILNNKDRIINYLSKPPESVICELKDIVPKHMQGKGDTQFDLDSLDWTKDMIDEKSGRLIIALKEYSNDVNFIKEYYHGKIPDYLRDINSENIEFLSHNLIIPKYAFPVDSVSLKPMMTKGYNDKYDLNRDLQLAITEYAPGSELIVKKNIIRSRYIKKLWGVELNIWHFATCPQCKKLTISLNYDEVGEKSQDGSRYCSCGSKLDAIQKMIKPKYGFVYDSEQPIKNAFINIPSRYYSSNISFSGKITDKEQYDYMEGRRIRSIFFANKKLATYNRTKFNFCRKCGYAIRVKDGWPTKHLSPWNRECDGDPVPVYLGHEFSTDIAVIDLGIPYKDLSGACSVLYALINGLSLAFNIERREIGGCLQKLGDSFALMIFDNTPGGVGYVKHLTIKEDLDQIMVMAMTTLDECNCGDSDGHGSCYRCLRSFDNQQYHEILDRRAALDILRRQGSV